MDDFESSLSRLTMAPYIVKAMALIGVRRESRTGRAPVRYSAFGR
jgi:hypothetical protein